MTITQLNLSHFLIIGPKLSTVNNSCPGQNFQNQVRLTNNASLNQCGSFSVEVLWTYGKDRPTKDDLEIALFFSKKMFLAHSKIYDSLLLSYAIVAQDKSF